MPKLNVFIDGSWLYKACGPGKVLASKTENIDHGIRIDFARLDMVLHDHAKVHDPSCAELGERYLSTSVFSLPQDFDSWPDDHEGISPAHVEQTKRGINARNRFVDSALAASYSDLGVYRPLIKSWILEKLIAKRYQEKQVDTTVVALLVRAAIVRPDDYHCVISGDADILPAIRIAYPEYSKNVFLATTHPDELKAEHRQTAFSLNNFDFRIPPVYLQDNLLEIMQGEHVHECAHCHKIFSRLRPIPAKARPCCSVCHGQRT